MDLELSGKVVIVTGGSDGLGLGLCHRLVAEGARVAICSRNEERLRFAADDLREVARASGQLTVGGAAGSDTGPVLDLVADVTRPEDLGRLVELTVARWGRVDGLVNNAGRASAMAVAESDDATWQDDLDLKLMAAVRLTRLVLPALRSRGGAIVNVLAIAAKAPGPRSAPTAVSRAAGMALTKALSKELGADGVRVNAVLVGLIESGQWERHAVAAGMEPAERAEFYERMAIDAGVPLGRMGRADEFGDLVSYLLSPHASYVSGTTINIDGGLCAVV